MTQRNQLQAVRKRPSRKNQRHLAHPPPSHSLTPAKTHHMTKPIDHLQPMSGLMFVIEGQPLPSIFQSYPDSPAGFSVPKVANGQQKVRLFSLYLSDGTHSFGAAFTEDQTLVYMQIFWGFDEAKVHCGFVPCPQAVLVHAENRGRLTDAATMHCECNAQRLSTASAISGISFRQTSKAALATLQLTALSLECKNLLCIKDYTGHMAAFVQSSKRKHL